MKSADSSKAKKKQERSDRLPEEPARPAPEESNGELAAEEKAISDVFGDDQDPFEYFDAPAERQVEEGSFEYTLHSAPRKAEQRPPQRVASPDDISSGSGDLVDEAVSPEDIQRETERWAPKTIRDTVADTGIDKVCRVCNKNLRGHRRFKDEKGYICPECDRDERSRRIPCAECGKPVPPEALRPWGPIAICTRCWADHESDPKLRIKRRVSGRPWEELEKKTVMVISAAALAILLFLLIVSLF